MKTISSASGGSREDSAGRIGGNDVRWRELLRAAQAPYRGSGLFAWFFARGKLGLDPVFRSLLELGLIRPQAHIVDIGCGQGLLASLLAAVDRCSADGRWPADWPPAPVGARYTGLELMPRDVERAAAALSGLPSAPSFVCADMVDAALPDCDVVVILDVLHYVDHAAQQRVLGRVFDALAGGGRLLLRVGDQHAERGFRASQWTDRVVTAVRGHSVPPTFCRPLADWTSLLREIGFADVRGLPMSRGTPFANVLLVADKA
ncbi:class I SAM-dependent methyltransferase [Piscinibacter sakaiensis]|uniref:class I SAM-dependent methyltransferase n=1 Tax=Piscinibacter sakaiensis TaxID=1547922 RepID=UPI003AABAAAE